MPDLPGDLTAPRPGPRITAGTDGPGAILVALDGTPTSLRAAAYAVGLARRQRSRLVAVYVRDRLPVAGGLVGTVDAAAVTCAYQAQDEIVAELRGTLEALLPPGVAEWTFTVRTGDPYREILALAREVVADAVVVGASARVGHRIAGGLAVRLVRSGRWPVTVVP